MNQKVSNLREVTQSHMVRRNIAAQFIDARETETPVFNETIAEYVIRLDDPGLTEKLNKPLRKSPHRVILRRL